MIPYDRAFYEVHSIDSSSSAGQVVPYLVSLFNPQSVVDVGCGIGTWAAEFRRQGVPKVMGIDGAYVDKSQLRIPESSFLSRDLEQPLASIQTFDLAISVEVAEHLSPNRASSFVEDLILLAPVVVFSAAVPFQGGTNHVNEQWVSYWHSLFETKGFRSIDCLRARFWNDPRVAVWYRQNLMVYASEDHIKKLAPFGQTMPLDVVHPELFHLKMAQPLLRILLKSLPGAIKRSLKLHLGIATTELEESKVPSNMRGPLTRLSGISGSKQRAHREEQRTVRCSDEKESSASFVSRASVNSQLNKDLAR